MKAQKLIRGEKKSGFKLNFSAKKKKAAVTKRRNIRSSNSNFLSKRSSSFSPFTRSEVVRGVKKEDLSRISFSL